MKKFKYLFFIVALISALLELNGVSFIGPFSDESKSLIEKIKSSENTPDLRLLRSLNKIGQFHADFRELSTPIATQVLKPTIAESTLEAIIQLLRKCSFRFTGLPVIYLYILPHINPFVDPHHPQTAIKIDNFN